MSKKENDLSDVLLKCFDKYKTKDIKVIFSIWTNYYNILKRRLEEFERMKKLPNTSICPTCYDHLIKELSNIGDKIINIAKFINLDTNFEIYKTKEVQNYVKELVDDFYERSKQKHIQDGND